MTVDLEQAIGFAVQIGILIGLIAAGTVWIKRWIKSTVSEPLMEQVGPDGGLEQGTTRDLIEGISDQMGTQTDQLITLGETAKTNRALADKALGISTEALTIGRQTSDRLDKHLAEGHGGTP